MYFVICPNCDAQVEVPANAVGRERTDLWNVISCDHCGLTFDYDDEEVQESTVRFDFKVFPAFEDEGS